MNTSPLGGGGGALLPLVLMTSSLRPILVMPGFLRAFVCAPPPPGFGGLPPPVVNSGLVTGYGDGDGCSYAVADAAALPIPPLGGADGAGRDGGAGGIGPLPLNGTLVLAGALGIRPAPCAGAAPGGGYGGCDGDGA